MLTVIAPYILVLWCETVHGSYKVVTIPQATMDLCEKNGHDRTQDKGWNRDWDSYQCIATGYGDKK